MAQNAQDIGHIFSPLQIGFITDVTEPVNADSSVDWIMEILRDSPDIQAIPVERDGIVRGVLPREIVIKLAGSVWNKFWQKDLDAYILPIRKILDATAYINKILEEGLKTESYEAVWFIVRHHRSYLGVVSLKRILEYNNELRNQDLYRASEIQQHLLQKSDVKDTRFSVCMFNHMAHEIGGDFYRVYQSDEDHFMVGCFDVAGKNISGALTTMALGVCYSLFEMFQYAVGADDLTYSVNHLIKEVNPPGVFVASLMLYIDFRLKTIQIHNCGFSPVFIFVPQSEKKITYKVLNPTLPPLGIEDEYDFSGCPKIPISKGLRLCAYSDGLTDMMNNYGERYGEEQTLRLIKNLHSAPQSMIQEKLTMEIADWIGTASLADDVTMMDIRFT